VHICFGPFTIPTRRKLSQHPSAAIPFTVLSLFILAIHTATHHGAVPVEQIREPGLHIRTLPSIRRQVSLLDAAATIENPGDATSSFWADCSRTL
jgi:hypothetical protein